MEIPVTTRLISAGWLFLAVLFLAAPGGATELRIHFQGPSGEPVPIKKAELLLVAWGFTDQITLPTEGDLLRLTLDPAWLRAREPEWSPNLPRVSLYIQAEGYASIRSEFFPWLGGGPQQNLAETKIDFRQGNPIVLREGDQRDMVVKLRRPLPRRIRFIDEEQKPVRDLKVSVGMFWSAENHCGRLAGYDPLISGARTDAQGAVTVPDGDFEYAISVDGPHLAIKDGRTSGDGDLITSLPSPETVVHIHRFQRRPLSMRVLTGDEPVKSATLMSDRHCGVCGACYGGIAMSDGNGRISKDDFYPEEAGDICFVDGSGKQVWGSDAEKLAPGSVTVRLPPGTRLESEATHCGLSSR